MLSDINSGVFSFQVIFSFEVQLQQPRFVEFETSPLPRLTWRNLTSIPQRWWFGVHGMGRILIVEGNVNTHSRSNSSLRPINGSHQVKGFYNRTTYPVISWRAKDFFINEEIDVLQWPSNSLDMNPIKKLWAIENQNLRCDVFRRVSQLICSRL